MTNPMSVALIDDDDAVLDSLRLFLERKGLAVTCYQSADAFLTALDAGTVYDCAITDVKMPGMTGLELQNALSGKSTLIPLILITGQGDIDMAVKAIKEGAFDFIEKPIDGRRRRKY